MSAEVLKREFVPKYLAVGEDRFYRFLLEYADQKMDEMERAKSKPKPKKKEKEKEKEKEVETVSPNLEFLDYYERFLVLYRREGEPLYLDIAGLFRKAAHRVYRLMLKRGMTPPNGKFLHLVP